MRQVHARPDHSRARDAAHRVTRSRGGAAAIATRALTLRMGMGTLQADRKARERKPKPVPITDYRCMYGNQNRSAARSGLRAIGGRNSSGAGTANGYRAEAGVIHPLWLYRTLIGNSLKVPGSPINSTRIASSSL